MVKSKDCFSAVFLPVIFYHDDPGRFRQMVITDLHTHGIEGLDTQSADPDTMLGIAGLQGLAGVGEIILSIYSGPLDVMRGQMAAVKAAMGRQGAGQARILGVHLEGPFLNPAQCGALDPVTFLDPAEDVLRYLIEGYEGIVRIVTIAPEREGAPGLIRRMAKAGIRVNMGHSEATFAEAETGFRAGARGITHLFNAMRGFHHREPGIAGFGLLRRDAYVEIIGDLVHLHRETIELVLRMKEVEKIILVSDSVRGTGVSRREAPREKGRLLGGSLTLGDAARRLVEAGFDEERIMRAATVNPRAYLRGD
ncbi:MAG: hypothetical protein ABSC19_20260 [Syntrophorhabdales bacterium]|jgi:N-acetylglucosamine-6-phosphate deacetylase